MADTLLVLEAESRGLQQRPEFAQEMAEYRRRLLIGELRRQEVIDPIEVTDADLEAQYEKSKDEFYRPFMADATEILVDTRAEADSLKARLAAGEDMKLLAAKHSQRPGAYHARGHLHLNADAKENLQPLVQATQDVEPGTVVGPVEVPEGFSLVRVSQRVAAGYRTMDEVRHILHYKIKMRRNYQGFEDYIRRLRERRADWVEWHDDAIEAVGQARSS